MEDVRELFQALGRKIGMLDKTCIHAKGIDISISQSHILYEIMRRESCSVQQVATVLGLDLTTCSRQIQALVKGGMLHKRPHEEDRRIQLLTLTEKGKETARHIDRQVTTFYRRMFSSMTDFERKTVIEALRLLNAKFEALHRSCDPLE